MLKLNENSINLNKLFISCHHHTNIQLLGGMWGELQNLSAGHIKLDDILA